MSRLDLAIPLFTSVVTWPIGELVQDRAVAVVRQGADFAGARDGRGVQAAPSSWPTRAQSFALAQFPKITGDGHGTALIAVYHGVGQRQQPGETERDDRRAGLYPSPLARLPEPDTERHHREHVHRDDGRHVIPDMDRLP
jgi:hypothetical protein